MVQESIEEIKKKAERFEFQYNKLKQEFRDYIETCRKNEEKKRHKIKADFSKRLLVVADSLNRLSGSDNETPCELVKNYSENTRKNIEAVYNQMLTASGLSQIEPKLGEKFDEQRHTAIGLEYGTKYPDNTVFRVIRKGYLLENNVIRPAEVIIIKKPLERKVIEAGVWDRFFRWIKPAKPMFAEINRKIVELEQKQTEKIDKITLDMESLRNTVHELDAKTKQTSEFERIQTEKIDKIAQNIESLRNMIHELDGKAKQPNEFERVQTEKIDKIPWM